MFQYMDDRLGFIDIVSDQAYVMDDFGNAVWVPFSLPASYFQNPDINDPRDKIMPPAFYTPEVFKK